MNFFLFLLVGAAACWYYQASRRKEVFLWLIIAYAVFIFFPTLDWSYTLDDIGRIYRIASADSHRQLVSYLFSVESSHVAFVTKFLHLISYRLFWVHPGFFHTVIISSWILCGIILIKIILEITGSWEASLFAGVLFTWSTSYLRIMETVCMAYSLCLLFILLGLLGLYMYAKAERLKWIVTASVSAFMAPYTYAIGLGVGIWHILFFALCIPPQYKTGINKKLKMLIPVLTSWFLGVWVFMYVVRPMQWFPARMDSNSAVNLSYIVRAAVLMFRSLWLYSVPQVTSIEKISLFIAIFMSVMIIARRKDGILWKPLLFFLLWSAGNYIFFYYARADEMEMLISTERYHFYSSLGLPAVYAIVMANILKDEQLKNIRSRQAVGIIIILLMTCYASFQHYTVLKRSRGRDSLYAIGLEFRTVMSDYFREAGKETLSVKDKKVRIGGLFYGRQRPLRYYADILLTDRLNEKILWVEETDDEFIDFLKSRRDFSPNLHLIFSSGGYL